MKKRSTVFFELEAQSNFLKNISSIDQMVNVNSFTPSQSKLLKINSSRTSKNTNGKSGISIGDLDSNFDAKKYGDEFNQSKYVTTLSNSNKGVKSPPFKSNFSSQMKKESISTKIKCEKQRRSSFFLNKFDEDNIDHEVFENNLKKIINTHIEYQVS